MNNTYLITYASKDSRAGLALVNATDPSNAAIILYLLGFFSNIGYIIHKILYLREASSNIDAENVVVREVCTAEGPRGIQGPRGYQGISIESLELTYHTTLSSARNEYTITMTDGTLYKLYTYNGNDYILTLSDKEDIAELCKDIALSLILDILDSKVDKTTKINNHSLDTDITLDKSDIGLNQVDNTSDLNKPISTLLLLALDTKVDKVNNSSLVPDSKVASYDAHIVNTDNPHLVTKSLVGLSNVDNTSDLNKPISTATLLALNTKVDKVDNHSLVPNNKIESYDSHLINTNNPHSTTALLVGLGNVINTGDSNTPTEGGIAKFTTGGAYTELNKKVDKISGSSLVPDTKVTNYDNHLTSTNNPHLVTKTQVGLSNVTNDSLVKRSEMGIANGVATLDSNGLIPNSLLPSYVDDVLEFDNINSFPTTGETGKIYVSLNNNLTYRWSGTLYIEISKSLALGETESTAYAGNKGKLTTDNLNTHTNDSDIHVTTTNKESWNAKYDKPQSGIPKSDLSEFVLLSLDKADSAILDISNKVDKESGKSLVEDTKVALYDSHLNNNDIHVTTIDKSNWSNKYDKPTEGIPSSDLSLEVLSSLNKANSALLEHLSLDNYITKEDGKGLFSGSYNDLTDKPTIPSIEGLGTYSKPEGGIPLSDLAEGVIPTTLPANDVYAWAKQETKPTYTADEVGALPNTTLIPDALILSDWNQQDSNSVDYIKNKPTIPTIPTFKTINGITITGEGDIAISESSSKLNWAEFD